MNEKNKPSDVVAPIAADVVRTSDTNEKRKRSGPIPGGHAVDRVVQYTERRAGRAFSLRVHYDSDKTAAGERERLVKELKKVLKKLEEQE